MSVKMGNPTDQRHFEAMLARAKRRMRYQRLLWQRLRAVMAEGRRDQGGSWRERYINLLERALRHEQIILRTDAVAHEWIWTRRMKPKAPNLRVIRGIDT